MDGLSLCELLKGRLLETEGDAAACEVVRGELHLDPVSGEDPDVVLAHLPRDLGEHGLAALELDAEHRARERLDDLALDLDLLFLDCQPTPRAGFAPCPSRVFTTRSARTRRHSRGLRTVADRSSLRPARAAP